MKTILGTCKSSLGMLVLILGLMVALWVMLGLPGASLAVASERVMDTQAAGRLDINAIKALAGPDVGIAKQVTASHYMPGAPITFTLTLSNTGTETATQIIVTDSLPVQVVSTTVSSTLVITASGVVSYVWNVEPLDVGESGVITISGYIAQWPNVFYAVGDTDIKQGYPDTNYGSDDEMWVGYDDNLDPDGEIVRGLAQFDLSAIPTDTFINSASLQVYLLRSWDYPNRARVITTSRVISNWLESSATWNTRPSFAEIYGSVPVTTGVWGWYSFDVTDLAQGWVDGSFANYGVLLYGSEISGTDSSWKGFSTREGVYPPYLAVSSKLLFTNTATIWDPADVTPDNNTSAVTVQGEALTLSDIAPNSGPNDGVVMLTLSGTGFQTGASVALTRAGQPSILGEDVSVIDSTLITCNLDLEGQLAGLWDVNVINPSLETATLPDGFTIEQAISKIYLPLVFKRYPPIPDTPVLNAISNPGNDGDYTVSWGAAYLATSYILEEDDNSAFSSPTQRYSGSGTSWSASNKSTGTYYYRVKAHNSWGDSAWSNVESVQVSPPTQFYPSADTTILQGIPSGNFGSATDMWAGYEHCSSSANGITRSLVRFNLSSIPAGTSIANATLSLYLVNSCDTSNRTHTVTTYRVKDDWSSSTTWNSQPGTGEAYGSASISSRTYKRYTFDITDLVRGWVNGSYTNYGLMLRGPESSGSSSARLGFGTLNASGTTYDPYITITYAGMMSEQVPENPADISDAPCYESGIKEALGFTLPQQCPSPYCAIEMCSPD